VLSVALHPLNQQCEARAKATGQRCERRVVGGSVCFVHGGNARQVKAKREQRVLVAEVRAAAAVEPVVLQRREAEEVLIDLLDDVTRILERIKSEMHTNIISPVLLEVCGEWMDRAGRLAKIITDSDLNTRLHQRLGWLAADRAAQLNGLLAATLQAGPLSAADKLAVWLARFDGLQLWADGLAPMRLLGDEAHRFTAELETAAAVERAAAEGVVWPEPGDADNDVSLLFAGVEYGSVP
jgi:hypothetical protein